MICCGAIGHKASMLGTAAAFDGWESMRKQASGEDGKKRRASVIVMSLSPLCFQ